MDAKTWMLYLIIMFAVRPICVQDSTFKMSSASPVNIKNWITWMSLQLVQWVNQVGLASGQSLVSIPVITLVPVVVTSSRNYNSLQWRHNGHDSFSNHQPPNCLLNRLFMHRSKKTSKFRVTGFVWGIHRGPVNSPHKWPVTRKMSPFDDVIMLYEPWYVKFPHCAFYVLFIDTIG